MIACVRKESFTYNTAIAYFTMHKNLKLGYILVALYSTYFWYAPWLLYLLNFLDLSQAALLQAIGLVTSVVAELPTGALSDLIGKKKTLILSFLFTAIAEFSWVFADTFPQFVFIWVMVNLGYSFYSGAMEAFMYDNLVTEGKENEYPKVISKMQRFENGGIAFASIAGGLMFAVWPLMPFVMSGVFRLVGLVVSLWLVEPPVDTEVFSLRNFIKQNSQGLRQLFQPSMIKSTLLLFIIGAFMVVEYEILDDAAVVDWGFNSTQIGLIYAGATLIAIPASYLYERFSRKFKLENIIAASAIFIIINYIFSPWIPALVWVALFFMRVFYSPLRQSAVSELLNHNTPSRIRAVTISSYELLRKIPYVILAGVIGAQMDILGVRWFSHYFAILLLALMLVYFSGVKMIAALTNKASKH